MDDFTITLCGAIESIPEQLKKVTYASDKKDIVLVMRYLTECMDMGRQFVMKVNIIIIIIMIGIFQSPKLFIFIQ